MACSVAVKRSLDIDLLHDNESPIKRRRTSVIGHYWSSPYNAQQPSSSGKRKDSGGADMTPSKILKGDLSTDLEEDSRKFRRKIFPVFNKSSPRSTPGSPNSSSASDSEHEHNMMDNNSNTVASAKDWNVSSPANNQPVFTLSQVQLLCERLLKEQNEKLRDEYKQLLESRMAEQYDTFMRFNYDQLIRNFQANGTGMSCKFMRHPEPGRVYSRDLQHRKGTLIFLNEKSSKIYDYTFVLIASNGREVIFVENRT